MPHTTVSHSGGLGFVFEAKSEVRSQANIAERAHFGPGTEFGVDGGDRTRLELHLGLSLNLLMNSELRLGQNLGWGLDSGWS